MSKEKQIEEMKKHCPFLKNGKCEGDGDRLTDCDLMCKMFGFITNLILAGYRKRSEGCSCCEDADRLANLVCYIATDNGGSIDVPVRFCPNCGAKMKGV